MAPTNKLGARSRLETRTAAKALYNAAPWYVQDVLVSAYGLLLRRQANSPAVRRYLKQYLGSQWYSPSELEAMQNERLRRLIRHAYDNVPYYRITFERLRLKPADIRTGADLVKLPLLSKREVRANVDCLVAANINRRRLIYRFTSGSTGTPLVLYVTDANEASERALSLRMRSWAGWRPGDSRATFFGYDVVPMARRTLPLWRHDWPERRLLFSTNHMSRDNLGHYAEALRRFAPKAVEGYPSSISFLARHLARNDETVSVPIIFTYSETFGAAQRQLVESRYQGKVFDWYGMTERAASAGQCEMGDGYHLSAEKTLVEVVDAEGEPAAPGEVGEIVGTNLEEYGMPLIRYRTGDRSALRATPCSCGRGLPVMEQLQGRVDDGLLAHDGRLVGFSPMLDLFTSLTIEKARVIQETRDSILVQMVITEEHTEDQTARIVAGIRAMMGQNVCVSVALVEDIPAGANGKYPFTVSRVPADVPA